LHLNFLLKSFLWTFDWYFILLQFVNRILSLLQFRTCLFKIICCILIFKLICVSGIFVFINHVHLFHKHFQSFRRTKSLPSGHFHVWNECRVCLFLNLKVFKTFLRSKLNQISIILIYIMLVNIVAADIWYQQKQKCNFLCLFYHF